MSQKHSTDLQAPDVADLLVLFNFRDSGRGIVSGLELEPTLVREMQQAYEAETCADFSKLLSRV